MSPPYNLTNGVVGRTGRVFSLFDLGESLVLDFTVIKNGNGKETEIRMRGGRRKC